ncbi:MAG: quinolinate synthase NadA [Candidatus Eisenbacteria bacterium]|uniref:Quinolinate synthase n=1 Tax=Eiseniibacteriota bacterium TaxID=2212470 RepID=A0A538TWQ6_UNCEI|nr:MAG: quinolinate synthase NadA [Candidatus Eisenbacteria bacterium]
MSTTLSTPVDGARPFSEFASLPASEIRERTWAAKRRLGNRVVVLGHHYQRESVIEFADARGDSFKLAQLAAASPEAQWIVFCGVHFMAESADILRQPHQAVILPDLRAGCSMADMAAAEDVAEAWDRLTRVHGDTIVPVTYMNSTAALKAFCGEHGGVVCTSSNARAVLEWAWAKRARVFFFPDQHLGRNTATAMGVPLEAMAEWDYRAEDLERQNARCFGEGARLILWRGFCSVHTKFSLQQVREARAANPQVRILVHPECPFDVVQHADLVGSTEFIIDQVRKAPPGTAWAIGTEINLVHRLGLEHPEQAVRSLQKNVCPCATMNRIDPAHLLWALENLTLGHVVNKVAVPEEVKRFARVALDQMLALKGAGAPARAAMARD